MSEHRLSVCQTVAQTSKHISPTLILQHGKSAQDLEYMGFASLNPYYERESVSLSQSHEAHYIYFLSTRAYLTRERWSALTSLFSRISMLHLPPGRLQPAVHSPVFTTFYASCDVGPGMRPRYLDLLLKHRERDSETCDIYSHLEIKHSHEDQFPEKTDQENRGSRKNATLSLRCANERENGLEWYMKPVMTTSPSGNHSISMLTEANTMLYVDDMGGGVALDSNSHDHTISPNAHSVNLTLISEVGYDVARQTPIAKYSIQWRDCEENAQINTFKRNDDASPHYLSLQRPTIPQDIHDYAQYEGVTPTVTQLSQFRYSDTYSTASAFKCTNGESSRVTSMLSPIFEECTQENLVSEEDCSPSKESVMERGGSGDLARVASMKNLQLFNWEEIYRFTDIIAAEYSSRNLDEGSCAPLHMFDMIADAFLCQLRQMTDERAPRLKRFPPKMVLFVGMSCATIVAMLQTKFQTSSIEAVNITAFARGYQEHAVVLTIKQRILQAMCLYAVQTYEAKASLATSQDSLGFTTETSNVVKSTFTTPADAVLSPAAIVVAALMQINKEFRIASCSVKRESDDLPSSVAPLRCVPDETSMGMQNTDAPMTDDVRDEPDHVFDSMLLDAFVALTANRSNVVPSQYASCTCRGQNNVGHDFGLDCGGDTAKSLTSSDATAIPLRHMTLRVPVSKPCRGDNPHTNYNQACGEYPCEDDKPRTPIENMVFSLMNRCFTNNDGALLDSDHSTAIANDQDQMPLRSDAYSHTFSSPIPLIAHAISPCSVDGCTRFDDGLGYAMMSSGEAARALGDRFKGGEHTTDSGMIGHHDLQILYAAYVRIRGKFLKKTRDEPRSLCSVEGYSQGLHAAADEAVTTAQYGGGVEHIIPVSDTGSAAQPLQANRTRRMSVKHIAHAVMVLEHPLLMHSAATTTVGQSPALPTVFEDSVNVDNRDVGSNDLRGLDSRICLSRENLSLLTPNLHELPRHRSLSPHNIDQQILLRYKTQVRGDLLTPSCDAKDVSATQEILLPAQELAGGLRTEPRWGWRTSVEGDTCGEGTGSFHEEMQVSLDSRVLPATDNDIMMPASLATPESRVIFDSPCNTLIHEYLRTNDLSWSAFRERCRWISAKHTLNVEHYANDDYFAAPTVLNKAASALPRTLQRFPGEDRQPQFPATVSRIWGTPALTHRTEYVDWAPRRLIVPSDVRVFSNFLIFTHCALCDDDGFIPQLPIKPPEPSAADACELEMFPSAAAFEAYRTHILSRGRFAEDTRRCHCNSSFAGSVEMAVIEKRPSDGMNENVMHRSSTPASQTLAPCLSPCEGGDTIIRVDKQKKKVEFGRVSYQFISDSPAVSLRELIPYSQLSAVSGSTTVEELPEVSSSDPDVENHEWMQLMGVTVYQMPPVFSDAADSGHTKTLREAHLLRPTSNMSEFMSIDETRLHLCLSPDSNDYPVCWLCAREIAQLADVFDFVLAWE